MTRSQRRTLELFPRFRVRPPTVTSLRWANRRTYGLTTMLFAGLAWYFHLLIGEAATGYVGVAFAAIIFRDLGYFRRTVALWPLHQTIID